MPVRNGYEVITDVKTISSFSHIPVIILATAPVTPYAERCKKLRACAYYTKPDTFLEYRDFAKKIYNDVSACINKDKLEFSSVNKQDTILTKSSDALTNLLYNSIGIMLLPKPTS